MAEIASQGRVGEQGGGEAVVFDTSQFFQNVYGMQKDLYARQEQKKKEIDQQNATWNAYLDDMPDIWQSDYEYVNKALNEYNDYIIDLKTQGLDPDALDPMIMKKIKELQNKVAKETSRAKDNETVSNQYLQLLNNDKTNKYNKEYATKWLQDYSDPNKTPEQRAKMRIDSNPFKLNYDVNEFVKDTMPEDSLDDNGRVETIFVDKNAHKAVIFENITQTETGAEIYESLKKPNETPDEFAERMSELGQKLKPPRTKVQPTPVGGKGSGSGGGTKKEPDVLITGQSKEADSRWDQSYGINKVALGKTKPVYVKTDPTYDKDGNPVESKPVMNFVPADGFYLKPGGAIAAIGYGTIEEVQTDGTKLSKVIEVEVDYEKNKGNFDAQGYPNIFDEFRTRTGVTSPTGKTYTGVPTGGF
jgi:hypothetical protein